MARGILFLLFLFLLNYSFSQCWDQRDAHVNKVMSLYEKSDFDSITLVLGNWRSTCEMNEELFRLSILNAIQNQQPIDSFLDNHTIGYLRSFETKKMESFIPYYHAPTFSDSKTGDKLNKMTASWAALLKSQNETEEVFLQVYALGSAEKAWTLLKQKDFPDVTVQGEFDKIVKAASEKNENLILNMGGFYDVKSELFAPEFGFGFEMFHKAKYERFNASLRFNSKRQLKIKYKDQNEKIAANSLDLSYDLGKRFNGSNVDYLLFGTLSHTSFISEYGQYDEDESDSKRVVSVFGLGVGAGTYFKKNFEQLGLEIRFTPINMVTNTEVDIDVFPVSFGLKYLIFGSKEAENLLGPIGYYNK